MSVADRDRTETGGDTCQAGYHAQIKAENRARIIRAARDLFLARGYDKTSLAQIAREARVSTGTLFKRYLQGCAVRGRHLRTVAAGRAVRRSAPAR